MVQTLLLPGLDGSASPHWQHWWVETEPAAAIVEQRSWSSPCPEEWLQAIEHVLTRHPGAIVVGHSLGAISAVKLLSQHPEISIGGLLLVAPAEPSRDERIRAFGEIPEAALPVPAIVVASRNDPWMTFERGCALANAWGADLVDMGNAGHINTHSGFGPWPEGKRLRDRLAMRKHRRPATRHANDAVALSWQREQATWQP